MRQHFESAAYGAVGNGVVLATVTLSKWELWLKVLVLALTAIWTGLQIVLAVLKWRRLGLGKMTEKE